MNFNRVKLGREVTLLKYLASIVFLIFLSKTLIRNKITFRLSNSLNLAKLVVNELTESTIIEDLSLLIVKISGTYN